MAEKHGNGELLIQSRGVTRVVRDRTVKISLVKAGTEIGTIISSTSIGSGGTGSYTWSINPTATLVTGSDFKVRVQSISQPTVTDTSNTIFTLTPGNNPNSHFILHHGYGT